MANVQQGLNAYFSRHLEKNCFRKKNEKFYSVSRIVSKLRKLASYRRNTEIKVSFTTGQR